VTAQYGPVIQYRGFGGENIISVSDPKTIQYMLMQKTSSFPKPKEEVRGLERMTGRGLLTVEGATHRRQARLLAPSFSQAQTETYLPTITEVADKVSLPLLVRALHIDLTASSLQLVKRIAENVDKESSKTASKDPAGPIIDVCNWLSRATLDIISICGFEYPVGALEIEHHELLDAFNLMLRPIQLTVPIFLIIKTINRLPFLSKLPVPMIKRAKASMALMQREAKNMMGGKLQEADNGELEGKDLISSIIRANKLATSEKDKLADDEVSRF
jgi:cytochrome P450